MRNYIIIFIIAAATFVSAAVTDARFRHTQGYFHGYGGGYGHGAGRHDPTNTNGF
jgi:hypothetical protein